MAGQPTKYNKKFCKTAYNFALLGATDKELASEFEVDVSTIGNWKVAHPEFLVAIKEGKIKADSKVAKSLYKRANGFDYVETKIVDDPLLGKVVTTTTKKVIPDVAAQNIWLKNRRGKVNPEEGQKWADKHEHEHSGKVGTDFSGLSTEELLIRAEAIKKITKE